MCLQKFSNPFVFKINIPLQNIHTSQCERIVRYLVLWDTNIPFWHSIVGVMSELPDHASLHKGILKCINHVRRKVEYY